MLYHPRTNRKIWDPEHLLYRVRHFELKEFACRCCGQAHIDLDFVLLLNKIRSRCGFPLVVTSGYRCPRHNRRIKGGRPIRPD